MRYICVFSPNFPPITLRGNASLFQHPLVSEVCYDAQHASPRGAAARHPWLSAGGEEEEENKVVVKSPGNVFLFLLACPLKRSLISTVPVNWELDLHYAWATPGTFRGLKQASLKLARGNMVALWYLVVS